MNEKESEVIEKRGSSAAVGGMELSYYISESYSSTAYEGEKYKSQSWYAEQYISEIYSSLGIQGIREADVKRIERDFARKTSITNKTDLVFLFVATAIMVVKGISFQYFAKGNGYGEKIDTSKRFAHDDKSIRHSHKKSNNSFRDKNIKKHGTGDWINIVYRTPPYDITIDSPIIGRNMEGGYHRVHTLGHDPILGWVFGTANIITDTITFEDFSSYRVARIPMMRITSEFVPLLSVFQESLSLIREDKMILPAAIFAEGAHLASDRYTKLGLPVPLLEVFDSKLASSLYKSQYDELCLMRDLNIIGKSAAFSIMFNMIVGLIHGLFYNEGTDFSRDLYEVRTRKILLISNSIGTASNILTTIIEKKPSALDIGGLLITIGRLFSDIRFIAKIRKEYIESNSLEEMKQKML